MNPLGKRVNIHFSSSPDTPLLRQELLAASRAVCVWAPPPPSWTNLPKDPPSKTAALHKKAQTDTMIILKPCGTGRVDLKSSSPFYHKITVNSSLAICCYCFLAPNENPLMIYDTLSGASMREISRRGRPKGLCGFPVEMCPFSLYNWRFSRSDHCGKRVWSERRVFIPLKFPSCFIVDWTRTDG